MVVTHGGRVVFQEAQFHLGAFFLADTARQLSLKGDVFISV